MAEDTTRSYQIGFAQIRRDPGSLDFGDDFAYLASIWPKNATVTRYNRTWRLTKILAQTEQFAFAQLGFVNQNEVSTLYFDEATQEFVHGEAPSGTVVPFAIRRSDLVIAFQLRTGVVRDTTFTGALQHLLFPEEDSAWSVESLVQPLELSDWLQRVEQVTQMSLSLERPNPHYGKNDQIEALLEGTHSKAVRISARAEAGESVDIRFPLFQQALDHVLRNYGRAKLVGTQADGEESEFVKPRGSAAAVPTHRRRTAIGGEEAPNELLLSELAAPLPQGTQAADLQSVDEDDNPA